MELVKAGPTICNLRVWEKAFELAVAVFRLAERIPPDIGLGLSGQMRVVALSIPSYIARGRSRGTNLEFLRGLYQARGALSVLKGRLSFYAELGFATDLELRRVDVQLREASRMIDFIIADLRRIRGLVAPRSTTEEIPGAAPVRRLAAAIAGRQPAGRWSLHLTRVENPPPPDSTIDLVESPRPAPIFQ